MGFCSLGAFVVNRSGEKGSAEGGAETGKIRTESNHRPNPCEEAFFQKVWYNVFMEGLPPPTKGPEVVADAIFGNVRSNKRASLAQVIRDAGYAESVARSPSAVIGTDIFRKRAALHFARIERDKERTIRELEKQRQKSFAALDDKRLVSSFRDEVNAIDIFTRNHQLLTGGATSTEAPAPLLTINHFTAEKIEINQGEKEKMA